MLLKPLQDADVRQAQSTAALQRDANGSASWRLNSGQCQAGRRRSNLRGSLRRGGGEVIDVSMAQVAARYAALPQSSSCAAFAELPQPPPAVPSASPLGADNTAVRHIVSERFCATC